MGKNVLLIQTGISLKTIPLLIGHKINKTIVKNLLIKNKLY